METAVTLGAQALIAVVVAVLSVRLALTRYYREKWWEKKFEAYAAIIDALHHMKQYVEAFRNEQHDFEKTESKELALRSANARDELRRRVDIGHLVISSEAVATLEKLIRAFDATDDIPGDEAAELDFVTLNKGLARMREIARDDLKAPKIDTERVGM